MCSRPWRRVSRHPDEFVQEFIRAFDKGLIEQFAGVVENIRNIAEIDVPKNVDQAEFANHRKKILNRPHAAEWAGGNADDAGGLVDVFFQTAVQHMFKQTGKAVVVLGGNDDEPVGCSHLLRKQGVFDGFSRVIDRQGQFREID